MRKYLEACRDEADASSIQRAQLSSSGAASVVAGNQKRRGGSRLSGVPEGERQNRIEDLELSFMSVDSRGNI
jgi:hypothetical protein